MVITLFYEALLFLVALFWAPYALYHRLKSGKYKTNLWTRYGFGFPKITRGEGPLIWVHAVSVGETKAIAPLMKRFHEEFPQAQFVLSSITETGFAEGKRSISFPCHHLFLPFDLTFILRPILKRLRPELVLISETDYWLRFLTLAKSYGATIAVVNGKISEKSCERFKRFQFFTDKIFAPIDLFCVQTERYKKRFSTLGVPEKKVTTTGNLKLDYQAPALPGSELAKFREELGIKSSDFVIVIGSTHSGEEQELLKPLIALKEKHPHIKLIFVPRHPERFDEVANLLKEQNVLFTRYSEPGFNKHSVILVDAMGVLLSFYQLSQLAIVGGSFRQGIGGHNVLEPAAYNVPVVFGPYMENQLEIASMLVESGGGFQIQSSLIEMLVDALVDESNERERIGLAGHQLTVSLRGATERTFEVITHSPSFLSKPFARK